MNKSAEPGLPESPIYTRLYTDKVLYFNEEIALNKEDQELNSGDSCIWEPVMENK